MATSTKENNMKNANGNFEFFHGSNQAEAVLEAIIGGGSLRDNFHMSPSIEVAKNYGSKIVKIELEADLVKAHVGQINKAGNFNKNVGNGVEVVLNSQAAKVEFFTNLWDAEIIN
jgi:hypothetical protein